MERVADRPGIEPLFHAHDTHTRLFVASHDGALNGRSAAPARQHGRMQIETAEFRRIENGAWQYQSIGDDDRNISPKVLKLRLHL